MIKDQLIEHIEINDHHQLQFLFGHNDQNVQTFQDSLNVQLTARDNSIKMMGNKSDLTLARKVIVELIQCIALNYQPSKTDLVRAIDIIKSQGAHKKTLKDIFLSTVIFTGKQTISPKTLNQKQYCQLISDNDIVFSIGPAGTGKTYLAMAMAIDHLKKGNVKRIVLTRPAVEAGERLGFLPGNLQEKVNPYLRPLYDALYDMIESDEMERLVVKNIIEVAPLAYMRGRTLNHAFIILDEAQNTTPEQMKMFLTRVGIDSKAVITGDSTQTDLPDGKVSGLLHARDILSHIDELKFHYFDSNDVIRHSLVKKIIDAYNTLSIENSYKNTFNKK